MTVWIGAGLFGFAVALVTVSAFTLFRMSFIPPREDETTRQGWPRLRRIATSGPRPRGRIGTSPTEPSRSRGADEALVRTGFAPELPELPPPRETRVQDGLPEGPLASIGVELEAAQALPGSEPPKPPIPMPGVSLPDAIGRTPQSNDRLALRAEDQDVRQVLALLSRQSGINILLSPAVQGQIRLDLQDVTFKQALDAIVRLANLAVKEEKGLVYVYSGQEMIDMKAREREPSVRVYHLNYIRASDLQSMIRPFLSPAASVTTTPPAMQGLKGAGGGGGGGGSGAGGGGGGGGGGSPNTTGAPLGMGGSGALTAGGGVAGTSDTGGNSLSSHDIVIVRDYPENLAVVDEVVRRTDVQPPQVLIEAVILSVQLNDSQSLGINFSVVDNIRHKGLVSGSGALINAAAGFTPARVLAAAPLPSPFTRLQPGELIPGYTTPNSGLKFGFINHNVSGFIEAIESLNKTNILASPRVLVLNKQRAEIQLGQRLGFRNTVTNLTSSLQTVEFLSVGTLLSLRPFVSNDGMIRMEVHPEKSTGSLDSQGIPQTNTSEVTTNIMVPDGATIVIGGLIDDQDEIVEEGVPGLDRIPVLGALFRTRTTRTLKNELIVLLTPRIIHRGGLPEPQMGLPPKGELGVPNSGAMPGPAIPPMGLPTLPPGFEPAGPDSDTYQLPRTFAPPGGAVRPPGAPPSMTLPDTPPPPPPEAEPSEVAVPIDASPARFFPRVPATTATIPLPAPRDPATVAAAFRANSPAVATSVKTTAPGEGSPHVVRPGEDFAAISRYYYGTPEHGDALWIANRQTVADPKALRPGTTIIVPPAQRLPSVINPGRNRVIPPPQVRPSSRPDRESKPPGRQVRGEPPPQGIARSTGGPPDSVPLSRPGAHTSGFLNRFRVQELASWPVPPGVSRQEALNGRKGDAPRGLFPRFGTKGEVAPRTPTVGPTPSRPPPSAVTTRPSLGSRQVEAAQDASRASSR